MAQSGKRVTIRDVAEATGLSTAAVSYALRGKQVSKDTEQRVRKAAADLGYEADPIARALVSGRTSMVGVLSGSLADLWQQQLCVAIGRSLLAKDRYALILDAGGDPARELTLAKQLRDQRVDGLIVSPLDPSAQNWNELTDALPVVSIGDSLGTSKAAGEVLFDNAAGVALALEHLHTLGHKRISVLTPTLPTTPDRPSDLYVAEESSRLDLDVRVLSAPQSLTEATEVACTALSAEPRPTALFCFSDSIAYGCYAAAAELGIDIPGDVSVIGYDNHQMSALLTPALTTFDWDVAGIVGSATQLVLTAIDGTSRRRRIVKPPTLQSRSSTAPRS